MNKKRFVVTAKKLKNVYFKKFGVERCYHWGKFANIIVEYAFCKNSVRRFTEEMAKSYCNVLNDMQRKSFKKEYGEWTIEELGDENGKSSKVQKN